MRTQTYETARAHPRAQLAGRVLIHDENRLFIAPLNNISAGGLFIDQLISIPTGTPVRLVVKSPKLESPVQAVGKVVRIEDEGRRGLAVVFTSLSREAKELIQNCVAETRLENALKSAA